MFHQFHTSQGKDQSPERFQDQIVQTDRGGYMARYGQNPEYAQYKLTGQNAKQDALDSQRGNQKDNEKDADSAACQLVEKT